MSLKATLWVLDGLPGLGAGRTLVMLALADFADEDGTCWPSQETIARRARMSDRNVRRHLAWLEAQGLVAIERRWVQSEGRARRISSRYRLPVGTTWTPPPTGGRRGTDVDDTASEPVDNSGRPIPDNLSGIGETAGQSIPDKMSGTALYRTFEAPIPDKMSGISKEEPTNRTSQPVPPTPTPEPATRPAAAPGRDGTGEEIPPADSRPRPDAHQADPEPAPAPRVPEVPSDRRRAPKRALRDPERQGRAVKPSQADWDAVRAVLPPSMQALPPDDVPRVAALIRERLDAGWSAELLRATLAARALPPQVRTLAGIVCARLTAISPADAPARKRTSSLVALPVRETADAPGWVAIWRAAVAAGDPDADRYIPRGHAKSA